LASLREIFVAGHVKSKQCLAKTPGSPRKYFTHTVIRVSRLWIAELIGAVLFGVLGPKPWVHQYTLVAVHSTLVFYVLLLLLRRFGLLALWAGAFLFFVLTLPVSLTSWYAGRSLAILLIPAGVAAWALWMILSAQRPGTESAG
jgi:hypothetical protein